MSEFNSKWVIVLVLVVGTVIGMFKGTEARQKWLFKMKNRYEEKRQLAEQKRLQRSGEIPLDDIELASFHK